MKEIPIACSLDAAGMAQRGNEFSALHALHAARTEEGIAVLFAHDAEAEVRDFVRRESECCPFLSLRVSVDDAGVRLDVGGPADARPIIDAFLDLATAPPRTGP